ncbi:MAG: cytochrome c biogenesis CcdA family protein [Actinomycetota bacterium]
MIDAPIALAFTAGMVATVNPCGFAMLPAYLAYFVGTDNDADHGPAVGRGVAVSVSVSGGFLVVFAVAGVLFSAGFRAFVDYVPWVSLALGIGLVALGLSMLCGFHLTVALPRLERGGRRRTLASMFVFGISYAVASLGCTLPVFLSVVSGTVARSTFVSGMVSFVAYGLGMSAVLITLTLAVASAKESLVTRLRRSVRYVDRAGGALLVVAGGYLAYYWVANLASEPGSRPSSAGWAEQLSYRLSNWLDTNGLRAGIVIAGVLTGVGVYRLVIRLLDGRPLQDTRDDLPADGTDCDPDPLSSPPADAAVQQS